SYFFFQAEDGIRDGHVTGVQTCALPISPDAPELEEREDEVVVPGVEVEPELDDPPCLLEIVVRLLHRADVLDLAELGDRLGLDEIGRASCRERGEVSVGAGAVE